jgi:hypothetical protein
MLLDHPHRRRGHHHRSLGLLGGLTRLADWVVFGDPRLREDPRLLGIVWSSDQLDWVLTLPVLAIWRVRPPSYPRFPFRRSVCQLGLYFRDEQLTSKQTTASSNGRTST